MKRKKIMPMLLSFIMLAGSAFTAHADNQTLTEDGSVNVPLTAVIESKYSVSIPASLTMTAGTPDADGTPFTGTVTVGVKGNINPGKAVVVLPMQGTVEEGSLTAASIAAGNTLVDGVTTEELNSLAGSFSTSLTMTGTADASQNVNVIVTSEYVRWASESVTTLARCETNLNSATYTNGNVQLSTKILKADTYKGNLQFTFKLVDRV